MSFNLGRTTLFLLAFVPISLFLGYATDNMVLTLVTATIAIVPLARIIGYTTQELTVQTSPAFGGFINATFGNAVELIIAVFALNAGLLDLVRASIVGSIINNLLLLIGASVFFGGLRHKEQRFNRDSVGVSATMLIIAVVGLAVPTVYSMAVKANPLGVRIISDAVAIVLALIYLASLQFAFVTHKHLFDAGKEMNTPRQKPTLGLWPASLILMLATLVVVFESELLVRGIEYATADMGLSQAFLGVVVIAVITNIAEKVSAIRFAQDNRLDVSLEIGLSSAIQIALFVVPILVFVSHLFGYGFTLVFSPFEVVSVFFAVMIVNYLSSDGKCNWLEGAQLMSVYLILVIAFYFV